MTNPAHNTVGRRTLMAGMAAAALPVGRARAQDGHDALVAAATKEGTAVFHTSIDLPVAQKAVSMFQERYPGIRIQLGAFGRREGAATDRAGIRLEHRRRGCRGKLGCRDVRGVEAEGMARPLRPGGCRAVLAEGGARRGRAVRQRAGAVERDRLQHQTGEGRGRTQKLRRPSGPEMAHADGEGDRATAGTDPTSTFATANALGWEFFEGLAKQRIMQVQSASDPPKKVAQGERSIMVDGGEYVVFYLKESGNPIDVVYAAEGSPLISGQTAVMARAPHPNAARLFAEFMFRPPASNCCRMRGACGRSIPPSPCHRGASHCPRSRCCGQTRSRCWRRPRTPRSGIRKSSACDRRRGNHTPYDRPRPLPSSSGRRLTSSTTAKVTARRARPSPAIAPRSPLSFRS